MVRNERLKFEEGITVKNYKVTAISEAAKKVLISNVLKQSEPIQHILFAIAANADLECQIEMDEEVFQEVVKSMVDKPLEFHSPEAHIRFPLLCYSEFHNGKAMIIGNPRMEKFYRELDRLKHYYDQRIRFSSSYAVMMYIYWHDTGKKESYFLEKETLRNLLGVDGGSYETAQKFEKSVLDIIERSFHNSGLLFEYQRDVKARPKNYSFKIKWVE